MNKYPEWWCDTVTLYHKYMNADKEIIWYKTILDDCFWKKVDGDYFKGTLVTETYDTICRIPKNDNYLTPMEWLQLSDEDKSDYFTIHTGDIIIKGAVDDEISEYEKGKHSNELLNKYQAFDLALMVTKVTNDTGTGRGNEHYLVRGK